MSAVERTSVDDLVEGLFRRESGHLVAALVRLLGPSHVALAEDVVHDALIAAMQAWRFGLPANPKAWLLQVAKNRAIDVLRRDRRLTAFEPGIAEGAVDLALSPEADARNQLAMMLAICDGDLATETHVTLVLRWLCGLSAPGIARAFLVDVGTIDRRLHRGRARLQELGSLETPASIAGARQASVERALYLLFNEGYHGSDAESPLHPAMCSDALRLGELLLEAPGVEARSVHALAALFCFSAARLPARMDDAGVILPLEEQDRSRWDAELIARGIVHLGESAGGEGWTRWHLEAGIAFEHATAPSVAATNWERIVAYYDVLTTLAPSPVVALNRALAVAEVHGLAAGRRALAELAADPKLASYSFFWAARGHIERRAGRADEARAFYEEAIALAQSRAERVSYERLVDALTTSGDGTPPTPRST